MATDKKILTEKESNKRIKDLKIELLKNPTKKTSIKKEIARLLTMAHNNISPKKETTSNVPLKSKAPVSSIENHNKSVEGKK